MKNVIRNGSTPVAPVAPAVFLALAAMSAATDAGAWEKHGTEKGVTVYTAGVEGSDVPRVKAVTTLDATTDEVWERLGEVLGKTKGLKQIKRLGTCGENCEYVYQRMGHPLIKDRHWVVKMKWTATGDDGTRTYRKTWKKTDEMDVIGTGALPVEHLSGSWTLAPAGDGSRTRITYVNHMDLGGNVPAALFGKGFIECAYTLLGKFRAAF